MSHPIYPPSLYPSILAAFSQNDYLAMSQRALEDPDGFWREQGQRVEWIKPYKTVQSVSYVAPVSIRWYEEGTLNVCANCIDRHLPHLGDKVALIWEGDTPGESQHITYTALHHAVCRFANVLKKWGVKRGDRVTIYLPMIVEAAYAMLACARIGAVHSVVFAGFSAQSLRQRIDDCASSFVITADFGVRGGKTIPLKENVDTALAEESSVRHVLVVRRTGEKTGWISGRDLSYEEERETVDEICPPEEMAAEDPLFILYTSGSTGKPKGVLHTTGGYLVYASFTHEVIFNLQRDDVFWCTADVGWITGHSYSLYAPLCNGATTLFFEGVPHFPTPGRFWEVVDRHGVTLFYTAPTAIRALMRAGEEWVTQSKRTSLRLLGTVGEPINPEAWEWYHRVVGEGRCPIVDTWWQTETGGVLISPIPGITPLKPGSATRPFFGISPVLVDEKGQEIVGPGEGVLLLKQSWPGQMRTVFGDHDRFEKTYFSNYPGFYETGDGCRRDEDGDYWITGRVDDVLNVSGHRLGTAEVESALVAHPCVAEAAVVGFPHPVKGQGIYAYVTLMEGKEANEPLMDALKNTVRAEIGPIATPDVIQCARELPKTRSGKIMRRILRKIAENDYDTLGDTSTLTDPSVVATLIEARKRLPQ